MGEKIIALIMITFLAIAFVVIRNKKPHTTPKGISVPTDEIIEARRGK